MIGVILTMLVGLYINTVMVYFVCHILVWIKKSAIKWSFLQSLKNAHINWRYSDLRFES